MKRRRFLGLLAAGVSAGGAIVSGLYLWPRRTFLGQRGGGFHAAWGPWARPYSAEPGLLSDAETSALWILFAAIGERWNMNSVDRATLNRMLELRTTETPSYLEEYRTAIRLFQAATQGSSPAAALSTLLNAPTELNGEITAEGHVQKYVLHEFVGFHLMQGGFRQFGATNASGYVGGPFHYRHSSVRAPRSGQ